MLNYFGFVIVRVEQFTYLTIPYFLFFPYISKILGPTAKNGFQIRILKKCRFVICMLLNLNDTKTDFRFGFCMSKYIH